MSSIPELSPFAEEPNGRWPQPQGVRINVTGRTEPVNELDAGSLPLGTGSSQGRIGAGEGEERPDFRNQLESLNIIVRVFGFRADIAGRGRRIFRPLVTTTISIFTITVSAAILVVVSPRYAPVVIGGWLASSIWLLWLAARAERRCGR
jgi:hypothetical protein